MRAFQPLIPATVYYLDSNGQRVYTLKKVVNGEPTKTAHPARFSPDDPYSRERLILQARFNGLDLETLPSGQKFNFKAKAESKAEADAVVAEAKKEEGAPAESNKKSGSGRSGAGTGGRGGRGGGVSNGRVNKS